MIELRWLVKEWVEWPEFCGENGIPKSSEPVLQYRTLQNPLEIGLQEPIWPGWQNVLTEYQVE